MSTTSDLIGWIVVLTVPFLAFTGSLLLVSLAMAARADRKRESREKDSG